MKNKGLRYMKKWPSMKKQGLNENLTEKGAKNIQLLE